MEDNDITNFKWRYAIQAQALRASSATRLVDRDGIILATTRERRSQAMGPLNVGWLHRFPKWSGAHV